MIILMRNITCSVLLTALSLAQVDASCAEVLLIKTDKILRTGSDNVVGINLNYIRDHDANRPHGAKKIKEVLRTMGVRWLRYPGGEKSDRHFWSNPPYTAPEVTSIGWYAKPQGCRMDFDDYMALVEATGSRPYVVVAYDSKKRTGISKARFLKHAVAWVKYANKIKDYKVEYWEIGNENWHNKTATPREMAGIVAEFSRAMKEVDPSIKIGASGNNPEWWNVFLPKAAPHLDFVSLSLYNVWKWKGYDFYPKHPNQDLIHPVRQALKAINTLPEEDRKRLQVVVAETNSKDYSKDGWPDDNSLGHAIVIFDTLGQLLQQERVAAAMLLTTRWMNDADSQKSIWYGLGPNNEIRPSGRAVAIWGAFAHDTMVACQSSSKMVTVYASRSTKSGELSIFVINKGFESLGRDFRIDVESPNIYRISEVHRFGGKGADDVDPYWKRVTEGRIDYNLISGLGLPGVSITVIVLKPIRNMNAEQAVSVGPRRRSATEPRR